MKSLIPGYTEVKNKVLGHEIPILQKEIELKPNERHQKFEIASVEISCVIDKNIVEHRNNIICFYPSVEICEIITHSKCCKPNVHIQYNTYPEIIENLYSFDEEETKLKINNFRQIQIKKMDNEIKEFFSVALVICVFFSILLTLVFLLFVISILVVLGYFPEFK